MKKRQSLQRLKVEKRESSQKKMLTKKEIDREEKLTKTWWHETWNWIKSTEEKKMYEKCQN